MNNIIFENVNRNKLHQELALAGVNCIVLGVDETEIGANITFDEGTNMALVQQIIDAHDPTPLTRPLSEIEKLRLEQAQANSELVQLIMMMGGA